MFFFLFWRKEGGKGSEEKGGEKDKEKEKNREGKVEEKGGEKDKEKEKNREGKGEEKETSSAMFFVGRFFFTSRNKGIFFFCDSRNLGFSIVLDEKNQTQTDKNSFFCWFVFFGLLS